MQVFAAVSAFIWMILHEKSFWCSSYMSASERLLTHLPSSLLFPQKVHPNL